MSPRRAALFASLAPLSWGGAYVVTRSFLPEGDPLLLAALRALPAGVLLLLLGPLWPPRRAWWGRVALLAALVATALAYVAWFAAVERTSPGAAAFLGLLTPVVAVGAGAVLLDEGLTPLQGAGLVLALAALLVGQRPAGATPSVVTRSGETGARGRVVRALPVPTQQ